MDSGIREFRDGGAGCSTPPMAGADAARGRGAFREDLRQPARTDVHAGASRSSPPGASEYNGVRGGPPCFVPGPGPARRSRRVLMRAALACLGAAVLLAAGCRSTPGRFERLASVQVESLERWVRKDPKAHADRAIASLDAFVLRLPFDPALDPLRARLLVKRGEFLRLKGAEEEARLTLDLARRIARAEPAGPRVQPPGPGEEGRRIAEGLPPPPGRMPEEGPEREGEAPGKRLRVREFLGGWAALPDRTLLRRDAAGARGTDIDVASDLDVRTPLGFLSFSSRLGLAPAVSLGFEVSGATFEGSRALESPLRYDGAAFAAGERVEARFRVMDAGVSILALGLDRPDRQVRIESGFRYLGLSASFRSPSSTKRDAVDAFFPVVGFSVEERIHADGAWLRLDARACGFAWSREDTALRTVLLDAAITAEFEVLPTLRAALGCRVEYHDYRLTRDGETKAFRDLLAGPFLGITLVL
jgi:hypothetical protein